MLATDLSPPVEAVVTGAPSPPAASAEGREGVERERVRAERLILSGQTHEARAILERLESEYPDDSQTRFLLGLLDRAEQDYDSAIRRFRRLLVNEPKAERVRLELGRTFFEAGDYASAERQFRYARAGSLPAEVAANVDRYLGAIRQRKTVSLNLSFGVSADSNLNSGPATDSITLYGLPFELSQDARATSGVGLVVEGNAEWAPRISDKAKLRIGAVARRAQYRETNFDDMTTGVYAGPRINWKRWEVNLLAQASRRWYGNRIYTNQIGGSADVTWYATPTFGLSASLGLARLEYLRNDQQTGTVVNLGLSAFHAPTPASFLRGTVLAGRHDANNPAYSNWSRLAGVQYVHELKGGLTLGATPSVTRITYDAPLAAFDATRKDTQYSAQLSILTRRIDIFGLTPRLAYTYTRNTSTIDLFDFSRSRFEVSFTSAF